MVALAVAAMVLFSGCIEQSCTQGSGKITAETRAVGSFNSIDLQGWGDLYITEGQQQPLKIEGEDNILPMLKTVVSNGLLKIYTDGCIRTTEPLRIYATARHLESLETSGVSTITSQSRITSPALDLEVSGAGAIYLDVDCTDLNTEISGAGGAVLTGRADRSNIICSGSGGIDALDLSTNLTRVEVSGSGQAEVNVQSVLDAQIRGSGSVFYIGTPEKITQEISGSGRLERGSGSSLPWRRGGR
jgi:hypothetical protein